MKVLAVLDFRMILFTQPKQTTIADDACPSLSCISLVSLF